MEQTSRHDVPEIHPTRLGIDSYNEHSSTCSIRLTGDYATYANDSSIYFHPERRDSEDETLVTGFELRDARIRELEYQCEAYRSKEKNATKLQAVNANLERRLDLLTQELARLPTTDELRSPRHSGESQSPAVDFRRRSTFPKLPILCPFVPQTPILTHNGNELEAAPVEHSPRRTETEPISPTRTRQQRHMIRPTAHRSPHSSPADSRPNSMLFSPCFKEAIWETPLKRAETMDTGKRTSRTMRKFASGSGTLKPLVLPAKSNRQSMPLSAPFDSGVYCLPSSPPPSTRPSTAEAHKEALQALEGRPTRKMETHQTQRMSEDVPHPAPLIIGLEPPSSAGTASAGQTRPVESLKSLKWLPTDLWGPPKRCEHCEEPLLQRQLRTWYAASLSLVLSIEVTFRYGPEALADALKAHPKHREGVTGLEGPSGKDAGQQAMRKDQDSTRTSKTLDTNFDSGYGE